MSSIVVSGDTSGAITIAAPSTAGTNTLTLPAATDTLVGKATTDTLTNKVLIATTDTDTTNTGSVTLDFATNQNFVLTLTGNVTLANPTTEQIGQAGIMVFIQDATGSRTLSLGTDYETAAAAGITLSTAANSVDVVRYFVKAVGSIQLGAPEKAFS